MLFSIIAIIIITGFSSDENSISRSPEEAFQDLLGMIVQGDFDSYANHVIDFRFPTKEQQIVEYEELNSKNPLKSFKILESKQIGPNELQFSVKFSYENGEISETKTFMKKVGREWKFNVKDVIADDVKLIREGN